LLLPFLFFNSVAETSFHKCLNQHYQKKRTKDSWKNRKPLL